MNNDASNKNSTNSGVEQLKPVQPTTNATNTTNTTTTVAPSTTAQVKPAAPTSQPIQPQTATQPVQNNSTPAQAPQPAQPAQPAKKLTKKEAKKLAKEKAKQERREKSNFRYIVTILFFIALFAFVFYLPEISHYINEKEYLQGDEKDITTGNLECTKKENDNNYDYKYSNTFSFVNNKLTKLYYKATTSGSLSKDEDHLEKIKDKCDNLKMQVKKLDGVNIKCDLDKRSVTVEQELNYVDIDADKVTNAYIEAGGVYPNYKYNDNINKIEKDMKAAGYTCTRTK